MRRTVIACAAVLVFGEAASAQEDEEDTIAQQVAPLELGARLGLELGMGTAPGGLRIGGAYLQRMTDATWFDGEASFVFGGGDAVCHLDRDRDTICEPGLADGFAFEISGGGRWYPTVTESGFVPFVSGGAALHLAQFRGDDVTGLALPLYAGAGGRYRVTEKVAITAELILAIGPALYGSGMGFESYGSLTVHFGVDFAL